MRYFFLIAVIFFTASVVFPAAAEEHIVERGETALQIALDHNLTLEQLSQLNPGTDLEMMLAGEKLIVPEEGTSFEDFRSGRYAEMLLIKETACEVLADSSAFCLFNAENRSDLPLFDIRFRTTVRGRNGNRGQTEGSIALMQILPGESLPVGINITGPFDQIDSADVSIVNLSWSEMLTGSFRISEQAFRQSLSILPDGTGAAAAIEFSADSIPVYHGKKINILAAAYDGNGKLTGIRSLYSDFYPRMDITVYAAAGKITNVKIFAEAY